MAEPVVSKAGIRNAQPCSNAIAMQKAMQKSKNNTEANVEEFEDVADESSVQDMLINIFNSISSSSTNSALVSLARPWLAAYADRFGD